MGYLNVVSFFCLILFILEMRYLLKVDKNKRDLVLKIQLLLVLGYNIAIHIIQWGKTPVEFSTVTYFVVPVIVLFNFDKVKNWAVYSSLLSGFFYYVSMILFGQYLYGHFPAYSVYTSIFNHGTVLTFAIVSLMTIEFKRSDRYIIWIGLALNCIWSLSLRPIVNHPGRIFIYEILDANVVKHFLPNNLGIGLPIYYVLLILVLYYSASLVHGLNTKMLKKQYI